ncbi:MAG: hypothetical protein ACREH9_01285, partial [Pseudomonadota bacterium]
MTKHSKKDPARPTRAKAARPEVPALDPSLADLLNPAIGRGRAGVGSQTGIGANESGAPTVPSRVARESTTERGDQPASRLAPPPDNSWDRRADFAKAHRARISVSRAFGEAPQQGYVGKSPMPLGELDPDLARVWGIDEDEESDGKAASSPSSRLRGESRGERDSPPASASPHGPLTRRALHGDPGSSRAQAFSPQGGRGEASTYGSRASQQSLEKLLREGRPEFRERPWT